MFDTTVCHVINFYDDTVEAELEPTADLLKN